MIRVVEVLLIREAMSKIDETKVESQDLSATSSPEHQIGYGPGDRHIDFVLCLLWLPGQGLRETAAADLCLSRLGLTAFEENSAWFR